MGLDEKINNKLEKNSIKTIGSRLFDIIDFIPGYGVYNLTLGKPFIDRENERVLHDNKIALYFGGIFIYQLATVVTLINIYSNKT